MKDTDNNTLKTALSRRLLLLKFDVDYWSTYKEQYKNNQIDVWHTYEFIESYEDVVNYYYI